jgi:fermentation-respiration switch protein FrsA (DUF1100 family)
MKLSFKSSVLIILATFMLTFSIYGNCKNNEIIGAWEGVLDVSGTKLRLVFNIHEDSSGNFISTMDSPDQGAIGINVDNITLKNDKIILRIISINGTYEGNICKERKSIEGMWKQGNHSFPLNLKKTEKKITFKRPQEPKKPYPYIVKDISFKNKSAGITLAGTLTLPTSGKPFPAVILITGSGPQDRDETVFNHRPFLILADYLSRKGIAVLRFDDRGVGKSTGDFSKATSAEFATDVVRGMEYLKKRKDIDPNKIGLLGHSEGGFIAPMIAAKNKDVAFIVLMAGSGLPGSEILNLQGRLIAKAEKKEIGDKDKFIEKQIAAIVSPWFRYFVKYDPRPALKKVKCPVLAINGEKDLQVPPKENLKAIRTALKEGENSDFTIKELKNLNHLFQSSKTGSPSEYINIEETISPVALKVVGDWIIKRVR